MIFVAGTMTLEPERIGDFEREVAAMVASVRAEAGCLHYSLLVEDARSGRINVLEQWTDDQALAVHLKQPRITRFFGLFVGHVRASTVQVYDISGVRPLPGM